MLDEKIVQLDIILAKLGYAMANLSSYNLLDLSKRILTIHKQLELLKKSYIDGNSWIDIRDVIKLREEYADFDKKTSKENISLKGHKVACLFFEVSSMLRLFIIKYITIEEYKEYLNILSDYLYDFGRIINIELLYYEEKL